MFNSLLAFLSSLILALTSLVSPYIRNLNRPFKNQPAELSTINTPSLIDTPLKFGDTGNQVLILQAVLASDKTIYPEGLISGYYGLITKQAVINFQKKYQLSPTGEIDQTTLKKFNQVFAVKPLSYYLSLIPTSLPGDTTQSPNQTNDDQDWGQLKQISEHTFTTKLGIDSRMGTPQEIFVAQNVFRQNNGKPPLNWDDNLAKWAQERAQTFVDIGNVDEHAGFSAQAETKAREYRYRIVGENSFYGGRLEATHLIEWTFAQDQPHKENMLSEYTHVGIGVATKDGLNYGVDIIFGNEKY